MSSIYEPRCPSQPQRRQRHLETLQINVISSAEGLVSVQVRGRTRDVQRGREKINKEIKNKNTGSVIALLPLVLTHAHPTEY
jgi:hypothetical protein